MSHMSRNNLERGVKLNPKYIHILKTNRSSAGTKGEKHLFHLLYINILKTNINLENC